jgi:hypothetical protein
MVAKVAEERSLRGCVSGDGRIGSHSLAGCYAPCIDFPASSPI